MLDGDDRQYKVTNYTAYRKAKILAAAKGDSVKLSDFQHKTVNNSPRPICYTKSVKAREVFKQWYLAWCECYREASKKLRSGSWTVKFPPNCLKAMACVAVFSFREQMLSQDYAQQ